MIRDDERFFTPSAAISTGGPSIWHVVINDQRRLLSVKMDGEQKTDKTAVGYLRKNLEKIPSDAVQVYFSPKGDVISTSTDPKDDDTYCIYYPSVNEIQGIDKLQTIARSQLEELDRFGPDVDLVTYPPQTKNIEKKVVFKYYYLAPVMNWVWDEMNILIRLPKHANLIPFDKVVVEELTGRFIGFTVKYIPGGTVEENPSRPFKIKWLRQLLGVVDELNLKYGISHQDIAPRNLLIDEKTDSLVLFDFNYAARIGLYPPKGNPLKTRLYSEDRNDVKGVMFTMYEIITRDQTLSNLPHGDQDLNILEQKTWKKHPDVSLDRPLSEFYSALKDWSRKRSGKYVDVYTDAPKFIDWPVMSDPAPTDFKSRNKDGSQKTFTMVTPIRRRAAERKKGNPILNWERPAAHKLKGARLLATGEIIDNRK